MTPYFPLSNCQILPLYEAQQDLLTLSQSTITSHPNHCSQHFLTSTMICHASLSYCPHHLLLLPLLWDVLPDIHMSNSLTCSTSVLRWHLTNKGSHPHLASIPNLAYPGTAHYHNMLLYTLPVH